MIVALTISALLASLPQTHCEGNLTLECGLELFTNLDDLLNYFRNHSDPLAKDILRTFERDCQYVNDPTFTDRTKKPFIVIIGNHRPTREGVAMRLAQHLAGKYMAYPAPCLNRYMLKMQKGTMLRRAFYFLCNYASAFYAKIQLTLNKAVVLNGYYYEQLVFSLVNSFPPEQMPPITSDLYKFPDDLLKPNLAIFIDYNDDLMFRSLLTTRSPTHWKHRTVSTYLMLQKRYPLVVVQARRFTSDTVNIVYQYIKNNLYHVNGTWYHKRHNESNRNTP